MVSTKDQSNAIMYCVCYVVCQQCRHTQRKLLGWLLKKVMGRNALEILMPCVNSVDIHSIECMRDPCLVSTVSTYIVFDGMIEKPTVSAFQNFSWIENQLNIKKVIGRNV